MLKPKFKKINSFSVLIIPDEAGSGTRSKKLTPSKVILIIGLYSFAVFLLSVLVIAYTPVRDLFITESNLSSNDLKMIEEMNAKMIFLTNELEALKSTNERLRYAIMLGDSTLIDSLPPIEKDKNENKLRRSGGNLFAVIKDLFFGDKQIKDQPFFFYNPANGFISREFLPDNGHFGIDYVLKTGSPVYAAASGYVIFSDYTVKDGYMIMINHSNDYITVYKHCSVLIKREREVIIQGELIALSGNSGEKIMGPHLHFEIWESGKPVNPKELIINNLGVKIESEE